MQTRVVDIGWGDQAALMLGNNQSRKYDDIEQYNRGKGSAGFKAIAYGDVENPVERFLWPERFPYLRVSLRIAISTARASSSCPACR